MIMIDLHDEFETEGFLGKGITAGIPTLREENKGWFELADDMNRTMMKAAVAATGAAKKGNWDPEAVATRIHLRACGTFEGVVLLAERGMVAQSRLLTRSLIEDSFGMAALYDSPTRYLELLKEDSEGSRRLQGKFLLTQGLVNNGAPRDKLQAAMDALGKPDTMSPKAVAAMGPLLPQYLAYQRLSDDSAHTSARALEKHVKVNSDRTAWCYKWGAGTAGENAATLHYAVLAAIGIGVAITQLLNDSVNNAEFAALGNRFQAMPNVEVI